MAQGAGEFARQLSQLGYEPEMLAENRVAFEYLVSAGRFEGTKLRLGFDVPPDFPRRPPPGPHVSPRILPINNSANAHPDKVLTSPFGDDWEYWSRPYPNWRGREPVETYLGYIARLLESA